MASLLKRFTQAYSHADVPNLASRHFFISGGTNGIGLSVSRTLYSHGAHLHLFSPGKEVADQAIEYIKTGDLSKAPSDYVEGFGGQKDTSGDLSSNSQASNVGAGQVEWEECDFKDLKQVASKSKALAGRLDRLDGAFLIAGIGTNSFELTKDGFDSHLTTNNLAHHVIMSHLLPVMIKTTKEHPDSDVRVISMSSELHRATFGGPSETFSGDRFKDEDEFKRDIGPNNLYARSKLGVILFTRALVQRHLQGTPILAYATHPGAVATGQQRQFKEAYGNVVGGVMGAVTRPFMSKPDQGSISALWAGLSPSARDKEYENGTYFSEADETGGETKEAGDQELIDNFYATSEKVIAKVAGQDGLGKWNA